MHANKEIQAVEKNITRATALPEFRSGDTVRVHARIKEGGKERIQYIEGVVLKKSGMGATKTFTLRKMSDGIGVELIYPMMSANVANIEVVSRGDVRRSRLYYIRGLTGKASRIKEKVTNEGAGAGGSKSGKSAKTAKAAK
jgi:large subunit ribosomal protein L19